MLKFLIDPKTFLKNESKQQGVFLQDHLGYLKPEKLTLRSVA